MVKRRGVRVRKETRASSASSAGLSLLSRRILAYVVDVALVATVIGWPMGIHLSLDGGSWLFGGMFGLLAVLYWAVIEYFLGQSIGKMVMGIRVEGKKEFWRFFIRNVSKVSGVLLLIDSWRVLFRQERMRFSEEWSGTRVVLHGTA